MSLNNNEIVSPFAVTKKDSYTVYELTPNSNKTVQPVALLRLSVFTPVSPRERGKRDFLIDASDELSSLEVARREGYTDIKIHGAKLNMSTDFKTWVGIISAFSVYGFTSEKITLPFTEFARMCGLRPTDINQRARKRLFDSMFNLSSVTLSFRSKDGKKAMVTHLVQKATLDTDSDQVEIVGDPNLWELYRYDHKVLLGLKALGELSRKEAAQSLYIYFESMPSGTLYVSLKRLRERLAMQSRVCDQNVVVRRAMADLVSIGYLEFSEAKKGREVQFIIHSRSPKLTASS
ncbi:protein RepA [Citrobacter sp. HN-141]|uniref:RepB family plasmid replication initiator protein n=1 Tax=unclassified Citrobacter TaxID=2644389 RepID=UPI002964AE46|nr:MULTISPECIES: RepB family plasmid replication initiator protein [unclassified Citrobacter]MDW2645933.1 protein RepA [Citrobacter sp. HN-141]MDW2655568.1 protein RepA [Citrobacter sp. HN-120]MDW2698594.1 protein RepA [Citrobacter sp. HN-144]